MQHEGRKGKPEPAQFPTDDGALWSVNICVDRFELRCERKVAEVAAAAHQPGSLSRRYSRLSGGGAATLQFRPDGQHYFTESYRWQVKEYADKLRRLAAGGEGLDCSPEPVHNPPVPSGTNVLAGPSGTGISD